MRTGLQVTDLLVLSAEEQERAEAEVQRLLLLRHPNVVAVLALAKQVRVGVRAHWDGREQMREGWG